MVEVGCGGRELRRDGEGSIAGIETLVVGRSWVPWATVDAAAEAMPSSFARQVCLKSVKKHFDSCILELIMTSVMLTISPNLECCIISTIRSPTNQIQVFNRDHSSRP